MGTFKHTLSAAELIGITSALSLIGTALPMVAMAQDFGDFTATPADVRVYAGSVTGEPVTVRYPLRANTAIRIDAVPLDGSGLDPVLRVTDRATGEVLAEDDDGGGDLASRAEIYSETARDLAIEVSSFALFGGNDAGGPFELRISDSDYRPAPAAALGFASEVTGTLLAGATRRFTVRGRKGELLDAVLIADGGFDPLLELYAGDLALGQPLAADDDGAGELNARLRYVFPEDGDYLLVARGFGDSEGAFTLRTAASSFPQPQAPQQQIGLGDTLSGRLGAELADQPGFDPPSISYQLSQAAITAIRAGGGDVTLEMRVPETDSAGFASTLDPLLEIGFVTPLGYAVALSDDDGGGNLDSLLSVNLSDLAANGDWLERLRIRARSIAGTGDYMLTLRPAR